MGRVAGDAGELCSAVSHCLFPPLQEQATPSNLVSQHPARINRTFAPCPTARLALLWFRSLQDSGYCLPRMSSQLPGRMAALPRQGIIILTYVLAALELTCLFMQFSILPVSNTHTPHQKPHTAFLLGNGRDRVSGV